MLEVCRAEAINPSLVWNDGSAAFNALEPETSITSSGAAISEPQCFGDRDLMGTVKAGDSSRHGEASAVESVTSRRFKNSMRTKRVVP